MIKRLDVSKARALPGVKAVVTGEEYPALIGLYLKDRHIFCRDRVRYVGDPVAGVAATSEEVAEKALDLIEVEYEMREPVLDPEFGASDAAPLLHPDFGKYVVANFIFPEAGKNISNHFKIRKGDVDEAFAKADVIVESQYQTPVQEHADLQPEAGLAYIDEEGHVTVVAGGQWTHADREAIAHSLGLPDEKVRIIYPAIGGAFGGREDMSVQIVLALRPMRISIGKIKIPNCKISTSYSPFFPKALRLSQSDIIDRRT